MDEVRKLLANSGAIEDTLVVFLPLPPIYPSLLILSSLFYHHLSPVLACYCVIVMVFFMQTFNDLFIPFSCCCSCCCSYSLYSWTILPPPYPRMLITSRLKRSCKKPSASFYLDMECARMKSQRNRFVANCSDHL